MARKPNGEVIDFKGLWQRGGLDEVPPDHQPSAMNTTYVRGGICSRAGVIAYHNVPNVVRMAIYKPLPPFTGTNIPRPLCLDSSGNLFDSLLSTTVPIYSNPAAKDFGLVNFFGRCYLCFSDGKVGLPGVPIKVYNGFGGSPGISDIAGPAPTVPLVGSVSGNPGTIDAGTYYLSYAIETGTGFITQPAQPFIFIDSFGNAEFELIVPTGPPGTLARWIITTLAIPLRADLGVPPDVGEAIFMPLFFADRVVGNNPATILLSFYQEQLINDASYTLSQLPTIMSGVGLIDYRGRMISYGEFADPSLVRVSAPGEPESFSATSGFIINDPSDSTGVRCATEFRNTLYFFKQQRGRMVDDNGEEASTWQPVDFDKAIGTEQYGIAQVMDAKGSSSDGFILADRGGLYYFNGVFAEPELSYKIRDLWLRISQQYFYLTQVSMDTVNKRIYITVALDLATKVSHMIFGDYSEGLTPDLIRWSLWTFQNGVSCVVTYSDFALGFPIIATRIAGVPKLYSILLDETFFAQSDDGAPIDSQFELAPVRLGYGMSGFNRVKLKAKGPATLVMTAFGQDRMFQYDITPLPVPSPAATRDFAQLVNLVSEQCSLRVVANQLNERFIISFIKVEGNLMWDERPR